MSRIGKRELKIPSGVEVREENDEIIVKGPKGELKYKLPKEIKVKIEEDSIKLEVKNKEAKALYGTSNALIKNMLVGVSEGYKKQLEIVGVGYRFLMQGNKLVVNAGYSSPREIEVPEGIQVKLLNNTEISVEGINKELVGEFAANIRKIRKPEPYKGKGIKYKDEHIRRKEGKKAA